MSKETETITHYRCDMCKEEPRPTEIFAFQPLDNGALSPAPIDVCHAVTHICERCVCRIRRTTPEIQGMIRALQHAARGDLADSGFIDLEAEDAMILALRWVEGGPSPFDR